jgi:hypothetical protein
MRDEQMGYLHEKLGYLQGGDFAAPFLQLRRHTCLSFLFLLG